jgi:hypothetical protein
LAGRRQARSRARYLAAFAEESASLPARPKDLDWIGMEGRAVNALRELGRFEEAPPGWPRCRWPASRLPRPKPTTAAPAANAARQRLGWHEYFTKLQTVIARKDASAEPFEMLPRRAWLGYCIQAKPSTRTRRLSARRIRRRRQPALKRKSSKRR